MKSVLIQKLKQKNIGHLRIAFVLDWTKILAFFCLLTLENFLFRKCVLEKFWEIKDILDEIFQYFGVFQRSRVLKLKPQTLKISLLYFLFVACLTFEVPNELACEKLFHRSIDIHRRCNHLFGKCRQYFTTFAWNSLILKLLRKSSQYLIHEQGGSFIRIFMKVGILLQQLFLNLICLDYPIYSWSYLVDAFKDL